MDVQIFSIQIKKKKQIPSDSEVDTLLSHEAIGVEELSGLKTRIAEYCELAVLYAPKSVSLWSNCTFGNTYVFVVVAVSRSEVKELMGQAMQQCNSGRCSMYVFIIFKKHTLLTVEKYVEIYYCAHSYRLYISIAVFLQFGIA